VPRLRRRPVLGSFLREYKRYLTVAEQQDLLAFLESLTGQVAREIASPPVLPE